jgi:membrane fusion protein (multidrug efflux system)
MLSFYSCKSDEASQDKAKKAVKTYPVMTVEPRTVTLNIQYPASLQGKQNVEIRPRVEGYIEKILIDEGAAVKKGQLLFRLDGAQYEQNVRSAEADIKMATAEVNAAQMQVNKNKNLVEKNIISPYELQSAEYTLQSKQAALAQAKAKLLNAKTDLNYTYIKSPVSGVIGNLTYRIGSLVTGNSAQPLTTVSDISSIYAYFSMNEKDFLALVKSSNSLQQKLNQMTGIKLLLADGSEYSYKGKIETVGGIINSETGAANFRAVFPNPQNLIRSGASATIVIPQVIKNAILIPQKSVYEIQGKRFVYIAGRDGKLKSSEITVMPVTVGQFFVVTGGLAQGDIIVTEGVNMLKESSTIKPKLVDANQIYKDLK